jgi:hypothetical protein
MNLGMYMLVLVRILDTYKKKLSYPSGPGMGVQD